VNEYLQEFEHDSDMNSSEEEVNIFGKGLADKIARFPGVHNIQEPSDKPASKYKQSYLSSIQSIRTIEKEKFNQVLQNRVNKLTALDKKFKQILHNKINDQKSNAKVPQSMFVGNNEDILNSNSKRRPKNKLKTDKDILKFISSKNYLNPDPIPNPQPRPEHKLEINMEIDDKESSEASDILNEIETRLEAIGSPEQQEHIEVKIKASSNNKPESPIMVENAIRPLVDHNLILINEEVNEEIHVERKLDNYERNISSKGSMKPAKVVFKKLENDVSRAERANRMAHFEYIESGLSNTHDEMKAKYNSRFKMSSKLHTVINKNTRTTVQSETKSISMEGIKPLNMSKFSPKRFRRFPRFTIFLNKDNENIYEKENSISLNPQFLNFLMTPERAEILDRGNDKFV
jgi:hypothetical protein